MEKDDTLWTLNEGYGGSLLVSSASESPRGYEQSYTTTCGPTGLGVSSDEPIHYRLVATGFLGIPDP